MKDAYYFPHDSNARSDDKILELRAELGWEGYGLYWAIIETLRENSEYQYPSNAIAGLSLSLNISKDQLKNFLTLCINLNLLKEENGVFYSVSLKNRMSSLDEKRRLRVEAGRKGGIAKANAKQSYSNALASRVEDSKEDETKIENKSIEDLMKFFGFNINVHFDKTRKCNDFFKCLLVNNQLAFFGSQFKSYVEYKTASEEKVHSFSGFLGTHENKFEDGGWNAENWTKKLTDFKKLNKTEISPEVYIRPKSKNALNQDDPVKTTALNSFLKTECKFQNQFKAVWIELLSMEKWRSKPLLSIVKSLESLMEYPESYAIELVNKAIAGNYQSVVFEDTKRKFEEDRKGYTPKLTN